MFQKMLLSAALLLCAGGLASAAENGDPDALRGLIADRCADCHRVPDIPVEPTQIGAPDFVTIAHDTETYSEEVLRKSLAKPHWPMTQFILSPKDIDDLVAYFAVLRDTVPAD